MALSRKQMIAVFAAVSAVPLIGLLVIALSPKHALTALGGACETDVTCDSDVCLHRTAEVSSPGACTAACKDDAGCPAAMTCAQTSVHAMFPGVGAPPGSGGGSSCVPRAWMR